MTPGPINLSTPLHLKAKSHFHIQHILYKYLQFEFVKTHSPLESMHHRCILIPKHGKKYRNRMQFSTTFCTCIA